MFTGIVEEIGIVQKIKKANRSSEITIKANTILTDTKVGDSIMVNGVCLTVNSISSAGFSADVMVETINRTNFRNLKINSFVNLERALTLQSRLGGHMVSGHIDGTGVIKNYRKEENAVWVTIEASEEILRYVIEKGSITIDGISLTVAEVTTKNFQVSIIPHTAQETTLLKNEIGDFVNLECDLIGKYVEKLLVNTYDVKQPNSDLTATFLQSNGFI